MAGRKLMGLTALNSRDITVPERNSMGRIFAVLGDIKIAHTIFALPFALASAHLAFLSVGGYKLGTMLAILVCMVMARTAAMGFNRFLDRDIDTLNPRTNKRSIPSGRARPWDALLVVIFCSIIFIAACWYLGPWPLWLSIPTLAIILGYSHAKRFTVLTHFWLGLSLAIAPTGAWIAVTGGWSFIPVILSVAVVCWAAGFDILYSLQDIEFDTKHKVFSIPSRIGASKSMWIARGLHLISFLALAGFGMVTHMMWPYQIVLLVVGIVLVVEHSMVKPNDFSKVGIAFFTMNGIVSILIYLGVLGSTIAGIFHYGSEAGF
jgi:4-hydroxybenzoate polyprenyltransferase